MFAKLRKCWRMLQSAVSLGTPENSAIQKLSVIIIIISSLAHESEGLGGQGPVLCLVSGFSVKWHIWE